jgi:hypothetical protein
MHPDSRAAASREHHRAYKAGRRMRANAAAALDPIPYHREDRTMTEVDQRITRAREYLDGAQRTDVLHMPPSALLRECAESRRQLAAVFAAYADLIRRQQ